LALGRGSMDRAMGFLLAGGFVGRGAGELGGVLGELPAHGLEAHAAFG